MLTPLEIFIYLPLLLLFLTAIYLLGHLAIAICKIRFQELTIDLFSKLLTGTYLIITFFSILQANGITFNLIFLILFGVAYWYLSQKPHFSKQKIIDYLLDFQIIKSYRLGVYFIILTLIFSLRVVWLMDTETGFLFSLLDNSDNDFYAQVGDFLGLTGQENRYKVLNIWTEKAHGIAPYHYFELWMHALLTALFPVSTMYIYMILMFTYFLFILFLGYETLLSSITRKYNWHYTLLSFIFLFSAIIYLNFFLEYQSPMVNTYHFIHGDHSIPFINIKAIIPEIVCLTFLVLLRNKAHQLAFIFILSFPIISFLATPGVFGGLTLLILWNFKYNYFKINNKLSLGLTLFVAFFLVGFWKWNTPALATLESNIAISFFLTYKESSFLAFIFQSFKALIHIPYLYVPFSLILPILLWRYRSTYAQKELIRIALPSITIFGISWFVSRLNPYVDWGQFFTVVAYAMGKLAFTVVLWALAEKFCRLNLKYYIPIVLCFGLLFFRVVRNGQLKIQPKPKSSYSKNYLQQIDSLLQPFASEKLLIGGTLADVPYLLERGQFAHNFVGYVESRYMNYMRQNTHTVHLSMYELLDSSHISEAQRQALQLNPVVLYFNEQKTRQKFTNNTEGLINFIKKHNLRYLIITPDKTIPPDIQVLIDHQITDSKSGKRFCILKSNS